MLRPTDAQRRRGRRVILLLVLLGLLNAFDLACTITVEKLGAFEEANPVAREILKHPNLIVLFKVSLVGFASAILYTFRRRRFAEVACWGTCTVYTILAFVWVQHLHETAAVVSMLKPPS